MPAYFNIMIEFDRNSIYENTVDELSFYLKQAGLTFRNGICGDEKLSEKEIIARNQKLLESDFTPEPDKEQTYIQTVYNFENFSSVRGFFLNNFPEDGEFTYQLVIPEDEVLEIADKIQEIAAERILHLITNIWHMPSVLTIQTATERKGEMVSASTFGKWKLPAANPYAIVSEIQLKNISTEGFDVRKFHVGGVILTNRKYIFK